MPICKDMHLAIVLDSFAIKLRPYARNIWLNIQWQLQGQTLEQFNAHGNSIFSQQSSLL